ncbi:MAG: chromosome segregation protein SMC [Gammaproteobacteria bacterium]|nr:MAG: chromosome segregation protein SMC [Gammaproteobacteria bacterium]
MRLSKIKLAGFKSFVDPTTIYIPSKLVGVVGPNGCGKSNIIDAVRWVMGETSAKTLRGDSMADVIFNGSTSRKPVGHASIELVFDNSDGTVGGQYAGYNEISIRRQVSRDGTSSYFLNNTKCRRRDITDIFLGTGLGPRSYSIIEQGMISRLIEAKPEDLRVFLEEAAGISKYKERRRETETRIRHTRENLDRLNDLLEEIEKQLEKLKRQSRAAERYKELKEEERQVKAELLALRYNALHAECASRESRIKERELEMNAGLAAQRAIEAALEKLRDSLVTANETFNSVQGKYYRLGADLARIEQAIQHSRESRQQQQQELERAQQTLGEIDEHIELDSKRLEELGVNIAAIEPELEAARARNNESHTALQEAEQAMHAWQAEWDEFNRRSAEHSQSAQVERTRIDHLERHMQQLDERLQRMGQEQLDLDDKPLQEEVEQLVAAATSQEELTTAKQARLLEANGKITTLRTAIDQQDQEAIKLQDSHHALRGQLASLETLQQAALGQRSERISGWLDSQGLQKAPRLAQEISVEAGWEHAVETVLGFYLEAICVDGLENAESMLAGLEQGAVALFDTRAVGTGSGSSNRLTPLAEKVQSPWSMGTLLDGVYAAATLSEALDHKDSLAAHESIVTQDGIWLGQGWLRVARDADEKAGVLQREQEIAQQRESIEAVSGQLEVLRNTLGESRAALVAAEDERDRLQEEYNQAHRQAGELQARLASLQSRLEHRQTRSKDVRKETDELRAQKDGEQEESRAARERLQQAMTAIESLSTERDERTSQQQVLTSALDAARERARAAQQELHELALRAESMRTAMSTTENNLERMREQSQQLISRRDELTGLLSMGDTPIVELESELETMLARRSEVETELASARKQVEDIEHRVREQDQERIHKERSVSSQREQVEQDRMAWQEIKVRSDTLMEQLAESGFDYQVLYESIDPDATVDVWAEQAEKLEKRIQRLGPINLAAIDEYEEESQRKVYLDAQQGDLMEALETLENAISKIDKESRARFKETFDKVNDGFQERFPRLFGGGHAYLELTGEDLLDTGVTVMARPPGKRNSTIHLLSGGEKALSAIALVFSIFELNPSPFCMLDEVDAPLDDTNVGRYCDMVREMSEQVQFVFITHNKITMEMANQLTGVTMHEPGVSRLVAVDLDEAVEMAAM